MNKITSVLFAGLVLGCASTVPQPEQRAVSKFDPAPIQSEPSPAGVSYVPQLNPVPVQPATDPIVRTNPFINNEIWVHGFRLGGDLSEHRQICKVLNGQWNYEHEACENPEIPNLGSPRIVAFKETNVPEAASTIIFWYKNLTLLEVWLDYCYNSFGDPSNKYKDTDGIIWNWKFSDGRLYVFSTQSESEGFMVVYALYNQPVTAPVYYCRTTVTLPNRPFLECFSTLSGCNNSPTESDLPCVSQPEAYCALTSFSYHGASDATTCWANNDECVAFCQERQMSIPESPCLSQCTRNLVPIK